ATVRIDNEAIKILEGQDLDPVVAISDTGRYLNTQKSIVESRALATLVTDALSLDRDDAFLHQMGAALPKADLPPRERQATRRRAVIGALQAHVEMAVAPDSRIARISFTSRSPAMAALIANSYAENYIAQNVRARYDSNAYARKVLNEQVRQARMQLQETERLAIDYARRNRLIDTGLAAAGNDSTTGGQGDSTANGSITTASLIRLNEAYVDARAQRIAAEARWRAAERGNGIDTPDSRQSTALQTMLARRAELAARLAELRARYRDGQPLVQETMAQLAETERQIDTVARTVKAAIQSEYLAARERENTLATEAALLADETLSEQDRRVQLNLITRDADTQRRQLNELLTRLNQINAAADITANNISLLDRAEAPGTPVSPDLRRNLLLALLGGIGLALLVAFAREVLDDALRSPEDAERKLGLPLLGTTPLVAEVSAHDMRDRQSALNEAHHSIRATVEYASTASGCTVLLITSSQPGEGKSTTALALARDFALIGRRVLLVDADLRNPSLHATLSLPRDKGLVDLLHGRRSLAECCHESEVPGLHILPLGPVPPNPVQILSSQMIPDFLMRARQAYDVIILDSAPVMGLADAPMLARMADHVVLIVEANRAHFGQARSAVRRLLDAGANIMGIVMTKFSHRHAGYSYDYHNAYYAYGSTTHPDEAREAD
ncbi:MAG: polysaccharide biosynthesis tyrosine autokinase, partial [Novosphingobium sp.]